MQSIIPFPIFFLALFLLFAGCESPHAASDVPGQTNDASNVEHSDTPKEITSEQGMQSGAVATVPEQQEGESGAPEQANFPGIKNELFKFGGEGAPGARIYYPSFGIPDVDKVFKDFAERTGKAYVDDLKETYASDEEKPANYDLWEMTGFFTADRPNPDIASITFSIYSYTGGAHGDLFVDVLNYDLKSGKEIKLDQMFASPEKAIAIFSSLAPAKLRKALGDGDIEEEMLQEGTAPEEANFNQLSLNPDGLAIEFQPYQVGPWAIGQQHVNFTLEELMPAGPNPKIWPKLSEK